MSNDDNKPPVKVVDAGDGDNSICWDESLFNTSYNNQVKLLEAGPSSKTTENKQSNKKKKKNNNNKQVSSSENSQTVPDSQPEVRFKHVSQIFKYSDEDDKLEERQTSPKVANYANRPANERTQNKPSINIIPPPPMVGNLLQPENLHEAQTSMLMAWYVAGYHTGYYEASKKFGPKSDWESLCDNCLLNKSFFS